MCRLLCRKHFATTLKLACSPFGSHVLETLLRRLAHDPPTDAAAGAALVEDLVSHLKDDLVEYISDKHATFFARALLQLLTGALTHTKAAQSAHAGGLTDKLAHVQRAAGVSVVGVPGGEARDAAAEEGAAYAHHVRALAQAFLGGGVDGEALVTLQRSAPATARARPPLLTGTARATGPRCREVQRWAALCLWTGCCIGGGTCMRRSASASVSVAAAVRVSQTELLRALIKRGHKSAAQA